MLKKEQKKELIEKFRLHPTDTGSTVLQITLLTERMKYLQEHFSKHSKDFHSKRGFLKLIGQRKRLLNYLHKHDKATYKQIKEKLKVTV